MSFLDKAAQKARELADQHPDKLESFSDSAIDKAGDAADSATGGKYADKVDQAQRKADDSIGQ